MRDHMAAGDLVVAGFWKRGWAWAIDLGICSFLLPLSWQLAQHFSARILAYFAHESLLGEGVSEELVLACLTALAVILIFLLLALFFCSAFFLAILEWYYGATPGKFLLGLRIVGVNNKAPGLFQAFFRQSMKLFSGVLFGLGFLVAIVGNKGQALHDRLSGCFVVCRSISPTRYFLVSLLSLLLMLPTYPVLKASAERYLSQARRLHQAYVVLRPAVEVAWEILNAEN